jgi:hypothetical protein
LQEWENLALFEWFRCWDFALLFIVRGDTSRP